MGSQPRLWQLRRRPSHSILITPNSNPASHISAKLLTPPQIQPRKSPSLSEGSPSGHPRTARTPVSQLQFRIKVELHRIPLNSPPSIRSAAPRQYQIASPALV